MGIGALLRAAGGYIASGWGLVVSVSTGLIGAIIVAAVCLLGALASAIAMIIGLIAMVVAWARIAPELFERTPEALKAGAGLLTGGEACFAIGLFGFWLLTLPIVIALCATKDLQEGLLNIAPSVLQAISDLWNKKPVSGLQQADVGFDKVEAGVKFWTKLWAIVLTLGLLLLFEAPKLITFTFGMTGPTFHATLVFWVLATIGFCVWYGMKMAEHVAIRLIRLFVVGIVAICMAWLLTAHRLLTSESVDDAGGVLYELAESFGTAGQGIGVPLWIAFGAIIMLALAAQMFLGAKKDEEKLRIGAHIIGGVIFVVFSGFLLGTAGCSHVIGKAMNSQPVPDAGVGRPTRTVIYPPGPLSGETWPQFEVPLAKGEDPNAAALEARPFGMWNETKLTYVGKVYVLQKSSDGKMSWKWHLIEDFEPGYVWRPVDQDGEPVEVFGMVEWVLRGYLGGEKIVTKKGQYAPGASHLLNLRYGVSDEVPDRELVRQRVAGYNLPHVKTGSTPLKVELTPPPDDTDDVLPTAPTFPSPTTPSTPSPPSKARPQSKAPATAAGGQIKSWAA